MRPMLLVRATQNAELSTMGMLRVCERGAAKEMPRAHMRKDIRVSFIAGVGFLMGDEEQYNATNDCYEWFVIDGTSERAAVHQWHAAFVLGLDSGMKRILSWGRGGSYEGTIQQLFNKP